MSDWRLVDQHLDKLVGQSGDLALSLVKLPAAQSVVHALDATIS